MRKTFSKLVSVAASAAMVLSLGAGAAVSSSVSSAEDDTAVVDGQPAEETPDTGEEVIDTPDDVEGVTYGYGGYIGFQTDGPYAYRDPCMSKAGGLTNTTYKYKSQAMLPVNKTEVEPVDVTYVDQVMSAEGEYTVSITGIDLVNNTNISKKGAVTKANCFNMLYITTNIPLTNEGVKATNVTLKIDGQEIRTLKEAPNKPDADTYYQFMIADNYASDDGIDKSEIFYGDSSDKDCATLLTVMPTQSVEISYTISGGDWSNLPLADTLGMKFTDGDFTYKVTGEASAATAGKVQLVGISDEGKAKDALSVPASVKDEKLTKAEYTVSSVASAAFKACTAKTVSFASASVTSLPSSAFKGASVTSVDLGKKIKKVPVSAFEGCKKLTSVKMADAVTSIGSKAFSGCTALKTFKASKSTKSIGSKAFSGCTALTSVTLGKSTKSIGASAFEKCKKLSKLAVSQKVKVSKNAFKGCKKTIKVSGGSAAKKYTVEQIKKSGYKKVK